MSAHFLTCRRAALVRACGFKNRPCLTLPMHSIGCRALFLGKLSEIRACRDLLFLQAIEEVHMAGFCSGACLLLTIYRSPPALFGCRAEWAFLVVGKLAVVARTGVVRTR